MDINSILNAYTRGEKTLEETNAALRDAGIPIHLDPEKNVLTAEDIANGYGLMTSGTGSVDKVQAKNLMLEFPVNEVLMDGTTNMKVTMSLNGKTYNVLGRQLVEA